MIECVCQAITDNMLTGLGKVGEMEFDPFVICIIIYHKVKFGHRWVLGQAKSEDS